MHQQLQRGRIRIITLSVTSTGAGNTDLSAQPSAGKWWLVYHMVAWQDDGAVAVQWGWTDADSNKLAIHPAIASLAANAQLPIGAVTTGNVQAMMGPFRVTRSSYPVFTFAASAITKHAYIRALVEEFSHIPESA